MLAVISQPNYIPWRGYFDMIDEADEFLIFDDVQYTPRDWRSRNRIKTKYGLIWLTVPVSGATRETLIHEVAIDHNQNWCLSHKRQIIEAYRMAPFFKNYAEDFFNILEKPHEKLVDLTIETTLFLMKALNIQTPVRRTSEMGVSGKKTDKLLQILQAVKADAYLSGPAAKDYIEEEKFAAANIDLMWMKYAYEPYPQLWGNFEPQVSVIDLLFNCGPDARQHLKSHEPFEVASFLK